MLEAALLYQEVISAVYNAASSTPSDLSRLDWQICECFYQFLKVFYISMVCFSGVYYPTFHHIIHKLYEIANQFDMYREVPIFKDIVAFMEQKFKKYWQYIPPLYYFAAALDPRMKWGGLDSLMKGIAEKLQIQLTVSSNEVQEWMTRMFDEYKHKFGQGHGSTARVTSSANVASSSRSASWKTVRNTPGFSYTSSSSSSRTELENYFETNFSVFFYRDGWRNNWRQFWPPNFLERSIHNFSGP